ALQRRAHRVRGGVGRGRPGHGPDQALHQVEHRGWDRLPDAEGRRPLARVRRRGRGGEPGRRLSRPVHPDRPALALGGADQEAKDEAGGARLRAHREGQEEAVRALVLAAGIGKRLAPLTDDRPKGLLELGGRSLLARLLDGLQAAGVAETMLVVGYRQEQIRAHLGTEHRGMTVRYLENPHYTQGPLLSLWTGRAEFERDDVLLADGDVIFAPALLERVIRTPEANAFLGEPDFVDTGEEQNLYIAVP